MPFEQVGVEAIIAGMGLFDRNAKRFNQTITGMGRTTGQVAGRVPNLTKALGGLVKGLGAVALGAGTAAAAGLAVIGVQATKTAISVETAFAGVAKTTDGLIDEFGKITPVGEEIRNEFRNLAKEVPATVEELLGIGELAGQLGVPRDALAEFTRVVADLGETTNLTQEDAATALAQIANIFQVSADDMAENTSQVGSALVALGNNFATTESDILAFAQRIAGAGQIAGLTQDQVLAIGTALSSVGVQADAGGTAVQKVLLGMVEAVQGGGKELEAFADTTGLTTQEFADLFEKDAAGAFSAFVSGLGEQGDEALGTLDELGLADQRLIRSLLSLAGAGDLLDETLATSAQGFEENTALAKEAATRYGTTEAQMKILKNTLRDVALTIGDALLPFLQRLIEAAKPVIDELATRLPAFIETFLIPALEKVVMFGGQLIAWLQNNLPGATAGAGDALTGFAAKFQPIIDAATRVAAAFMEHWPAIQATATEVFAALKGIFETTLPILINNVTVALDAIALFWSEHGEKIIAAIGFAFEFIGAVVASTMAVISGIIATVLALIAGDWEGVKEAILGTLGALFSNALSLVDTNLGEFIETWQGVFDLAVIIVETTIQNAIDAIVAGIAGAIVAGRDFVQGLIDGIKEKAADAIQAVKDLVSDILDAGAALLGLGSPSELTREWGEDFIAGFVKGIKDAEPDLESAFGALQGLARDLVTIGTRAGDFVIGQREEILAMTDDQIRAQEEHIKQLQQEGADMITLMNAVRDLNNLEGDRAKAAQDLAEAEAQVLQIQQQQERLKFLQEQFSLLEKIREAGLDPAEILGGIELGLNADRGALLEAMTRAMEALINQAETELGVSSPSTVFQAIGEDLVAGLNRGLEIAGLATEGLTRAELAARAVVSAAPAAVTAPNVVNRSAQINFGDVNLAGGIDFAQFRTWFERVLEESIL